MWLKIALGLMVVIPLCLALFGGSVGNWKRQRDNMVDSQLMARGIRDPVVLEAMRNVERHLFVPVARRGQAYEDHPLLIGQGQTISQPYIVAFMTEAAQVNKQSRVLEIGTGSGYQAAVLAEIVKEVYSIEIIQSLADSARARLSGLGYTNIYVRHGDGYLGWPEVAPFDAIIVTAAPPQIPPDLFAQLREGGRMVVPVGVGLQELLVVIKDKGEMNILRRFPVTFVPMIREDKASGGTK